MGLSWSEGLRSVKAAAPGALPILCHRFGEAVDWPQAANAGAFHSLLLPFDLREVRQSLGFVRDSPRCPATLPKSDRVAPHSNEGVLQTDLMPAGR